MATRFPGALDRDPDELPDNIADSDNLNSPNHATVHNNVNGAVLQIEEKLGTGDTTPASGAVLIGTGTGTSAWDTTPTFVGDVTIPEGDLILGSTAVSSSAAELNLLDGSTAGTVVASKAVVVDANKDISSFRNITATGDVTMPEGDLILGSTAVTASATEINVLDGVTGGTVAASKGVVVDANKDVTGFRNVTATGDVTIPDGDLILGSTAVTATAAELNILDGSGTSWTESTPSWTNVTVGNASTNTMRHIVIGKVCVAQFKIVFGSTTSVGGTVSLAPPLNCDYVHWQMAGNAWFHDTSGGKLYQGQCVLTSATNVSFYGIFHAVGSYSYSGGLTASTPAPSWGTGDSFTGQIVYRLP